MDGRRNAVRARALVSARVRFVRNHGSERLNTLCGWRAPVTPNGPCLIAHIREFGD